MPTVLIPPSPVKRVARTPRQPRLSVAWESRGHSFRTSLSAYIAGPKPLKNKWAGPYFRDSRIEMRFPFRAVAASFIWHVAILCIIPLPFWARILPHPKPQLPLPQVELTWYEPERDLPPLTMPGTPSKSAEEPSPPGEPEKALPRRGAEAFHPRQTILSLPQKVTHPRQTLIRPGAPEAPKILPPLPNIVNWADSAPTNPRLRIRPSASAPSRRRAGQAVMPEAPQVEKALGQMNFAAGQTTPQPRLPVAGATAPTRRSRSGGEMSVPEAPNLEKNPGQLNFAAGQVTNPQPRLPVFPSVAPVQRRRTDEGAPAPEAPRLEAPSSQVNFGSSAANEPQPKMPAGQSASAPVRGNKRTTMKDAGPAPEIGPASSGDASTQRFIALSATPAPVPPPAKPPEGSLSAKLTISPEGKQPGVPGGAARGPAGTTGGSGANSAAEAIGGKGGVTNSRTGTAQGGAGSGKGVPGPAGITISPSAGGLTYPVAGPAGTTAPGTAARPGITAVSPPGSMTPANSSRPASAPVASTQPPAAKAPPTQPQPEPANPSRTPAMGMENIEAAATPEQILGDKRIYTLYVNMPNLTSTTGSWVLNFAELQSEGISDGAGDGNLSGPVPVRKVDPKYPPTLIAGHVEGEVVLYAIIRRDGSVDSIQLLKGVEPELDQNAMEALARWKFRPALRRGTPAELEAVVHIPFRSTPPL
jgi:TonB family protein